VKSGPSIFIKTFA